MFDFKTSHLVFFHHYLTVYYNQDPLIQKLHLSGIELSSMNTEVMNVQMIQKNIRVTDVQIIQKNIRTINVQVLYE